MPAPRLAPGDIPQKAMTYILHGLRTIRYGEIVRRPWRKIGRASCRERV